MSGIAARISSYGVAGEVRLRILMVLISGLAGGAGGRGLLL